jgi:hypothetical protein
MDLALSLIPFQENTSSRFEGFGTHKNNPRSRPAEDQTVSEAATYNEATIVYGAKGKGAVKSIQPGLLIDVYA